MKRCTTASEILVTLERLDKAQKGLSAAVGIMFFGALSLLPLTQVPHGQKPLPIVVWGCALAFMVGAGQDVLPRLVSWLELRRLGQDIANIEWGRVQDSQHDWINLEHRRQCLLKRVWSGSALGPHQETDQETMNRLVKERG